VKQDSEQILPNILHYIYITLHEVDGMKKGADSTGKVMHM